MCMSSRDQKKSYRSMSSRSQHVITRPESVVLKVISHTRPEVISQHVITIAACHPRSSRHFACTHHFVAVVLPKWGSPGPTSRCRGVSLWCTGPTRAPLKPTHCQFLQLLFLLFIIKCFATRSSRGVSILSSLFYSCRASLTPRSPILCSRLFITLCRASLAQPNILLSYKWLSKKNREKTRTC